jgi:hypothetical protein
MTPGIPYRHPPRSVYTGPMGTHITIRLSDQEREELKQIAEKAGITVTSLVRSRVLGKSIEHEKKPRAEVSGGAVSYRSVYTPPSGLCPRCTRMGKPACEDCRKKHGRIA